VTREPRIAVSRNASACSRRASCKYYLNQQVNSAHDPASSNVIGGRRQFFPARQSLADARVPRRGKRTASRG